MQLPVDTAVGVADLGWVEREGVIMYRAAHWLEVDGVSMMDRYAWHDIEPRFGNGVVAGVEASPPPQRSNAWRVQHSQRL